MSSAHRFRSPQSPLLRDLALQRRLGEGGAGGWQLGPDAGEQLLDGDDLDARVVLLPEVGVVEARRGRLGDHGLGGGFQGDQHAYRLLLAIEDADKVAHHGDGDVFAALDGDDGPLVVLFGPGEEGDDAVDAPVGALLFAGDGLRAEAVEGPPLELVLVMGGEVAGAGQVHGLADDGDLEAGEGVLHAAANEADGEVGHVDAEPAATELLGGVDGGAAAAEGVQDDVARAGGGVDDALKQGEWLLGGVAEALLGDRINRVYVCPNVVNLPSSAAFRKILLVGPLISLLYLSNLSI